MNSGGLSKTRLSRMHDIMAGHVARGQVPGLVTLISRRGEVQVDAVGMKAAGGPGTSTTGPCGATPSSALPRITKPVTAAAAMILVEECKLRLDEPVDRLLPELADRQVLKRIDSPLDDTVPAKRPITLRDLLTFRLGHRSSHGFPRTTPDPEGDGRGGHRPGPMLACLCARRADEALGSLPLLHQPGEKWMYNSGSDILGVLIARAAGQTLGTFLGERIFAPLGMKDTGFSVPAAKIDRLATCYRTDPATGKLLIFDEARGGRFARPPVFESGAGGLVSTVDDYLAFCRMMLNGGKHGRERILSRLSVELMTTDHLTPEQKAASEFFPGFWDTRGWGFGLSMITRRDDVAGVPGRFGWDGGYGTSGYSDPKEDLVAILMTQCLWDSPIPPAVQLDFWTSVYQAIDD